MLQALKLANPHLEFYSVLDEAFRPYGRVLPGDPAGLFEALADMPIPAEGNHYEASIPALEAVPVMVSWQRAVFGTECIQAGYCNGNGNRLNALEYHKSSEVNYSTTGLVLLLALPEDLRDGKLESSAVRAFYLPPRVAVEIHPRVFHFAPCRVRDEGFRCLVVLPRGTNSPLDHTDPNAPGEEALLWMRNKWMICHGDSPQAEKGAFVGIRGDNLAVELPKIR